MALRTANGYCCQGSRSYSDEGEELHRRDSAAELLRRSLAAWQATSWRSVTRSIGAPSSQQHPFGAHDTACPSPRSHSLSWFSRKGSLTSHPTEYCQKTHRTGHRIRDTRTPSITNLRLSHPAPSSPSGGEILVLG